MNWGVLFLFFFSAASALSSELWIDPQWLRLVHYRPRLIFPGYVSEADGKEFFLSQEGRKNPQAEFEATVQGFYSAVSDKPDDHPQCKFPARLAWMKKKNILDLSKLPQVSCKLFNNFKEMAAAKSLTAVFSSYYMSNPSSTFGHTLLRLNRAKEGALPQEKFELLDVGINYAARMETQNPVLYSVMGLLGGFKGYFNSVPYYYKVREYNDSEARDIWEYDLNLPQETVDMLVAHLWELGATYFDYYFLSENCSYHLLAAMDGVDASLNLAARTTIYVIPVDTLRILKDTPGLIKNVHYRPSLSTQYQRRISQLSTDEKSVLENLIYERDVQSLPKDFTLTTQAKILDTAIDYWDTHYVEKLIREPDSQMIAMKKKFLVARSQTGVKGEDLNIPAPENLRPDLGHGTARSGIAHGWRSGGQRYIHLAQRFSLHDLLDPQTGYPEYGWIELFHFAGNIMYSGPRRPVIEIDEITFARIMNLSPLARFEKPVSWRVRVGEAALYDRACTWNCPAAVLDGGAGLTLAWGGVRSSLAVYGFLDGELLASPWLDSKFPVTLGAGPAAGLRLKVMSQWTVGAESGIRYRLGMKSAWNPSALVETRWSWKDRWAVNLKGTTNPRQWDLSTGIFYYF